jgi:hypothetical protein
MMGDCLQTVSASKKTIVIDTYGGSAWRWGAKATLRYSRRDATWQLVRVDDLSFHASDPEHVEKHSYKPPRDFGKIDIEEFEFFDYRGKGEK